MTKVCKQCKGEIPKKAKKCKHCGSKVALSKLQIGIIIVVSIVVISVIAGSPSSSTDTKRTSSESSTQKTSLIVVVGDDVTIEANTSTIPVAVDKEAFDDLTKAAVAGDDIGFAQIFLEGRAFPIKSGTKAKVIESDWFKKKVRILEGDELGLAGWVNNEVIVK